MEKTMMDITGVIINYDLKILFWCKVCTKTFSKH